MDFDEYQKLAARTGYGPKEDKNFVFMIYTMGLAGEAGEVVEKMKKPLRDRGGVFSKEEVLTIKKELGDVLWYLSELARFFELPLNDVAQTNIDKLADRLNRGTLGGSGDAR
jgi:NTP pyrophosphatase (non-canonical NTP hydrolase)